MRQRLMNVSLLQGWLPATLFAITAALMVILLIGAIATIRKAGLKPVLMPLVIAAVAGAVGFVITWLLSDVFMVFGVELGPHVFVWTSAGCATVGFAVTHMAMRRRASRALAVILVIFALLASALGIDQAYGEYATLGSLFGVDSYHEADLTGMADRRDLITIAQWRQGVADHTIRNVPSHGAVDKVDIPATTSGFKARKALVYLPPAALVPTKAKPALPVILMLSGQPGCPNRVFNAGGIQTMMDDYAQHPVSYTHLTLPTIA